ncbi:MAG: extradiol dioxygenase [SAR202 cluster bacterium]|nr:extradiol dioxygenase [SAR202 cluster bacterium]
MIMGVHTLVYTKDAEADRAFFRDVLGLDNVDSGGGWLIYALPPAEMSVHPLDEPFHEMYLMCDDIDATLEDLKRKGVNVTQAATDQPRGRIARIGLPSGTELGIYQPKHKMAIKPAPRAPR